MPLARVTSENYALGMYYHSFASAVSIAHPESPLDSTAPNRRLPRPAQRLPAAYWRRSFGPPSALGPKMVQPSAWVETSPPTPPPASASAGTSAAPPPDHAGRLPALKRPVSRSPGTGSEDAPASFTEKAAEAAAKRPRQQRLRSPSGLARCCSILSARRARRPARSPATRRSHRPRRGGEEGKKSEGRTIVQTE